MFAVAPLVINDVVVTGTNSGTLYLLDAATGKKLWSTELGAAIGTGFYDSGMGVGDGKLLVPAGGVLSAWAPAKH